MKKNDAFYIMWFFIVAGLAANIFLGRTFFGWIFFLPAIWWSALNSFFSRHPQSRARVFWYPLSLVFGIVLVGFSFYTLYGIKQFSEGLWGDNYLHAEHVEIGQIDPTERSWLRVPATAKDITYGAHHNWGGSHYAEFTLTTEEFVQYAKEQKWNYQKITDVAMVRQYLERMKNTNPEMPRGELAVTNGYFFVDLKENGGGVMVVYDADQPRVYLAASNR